MATKNTAPAAAQPELFDDVHTKFEAYAGKEPYLFVSYSHRDSKVVYSILDELYDHKYRLWYDESCENGNDFRDELRGDPLRVPMVHGLTLLRHGDHRGTGVRQAPVPHLSG